MKNILVPTAALFAAAGLSGCVIDAGSDSWDESYDLRERTKLAVEACGEGNVAEVTSKGFSCKNEGR
jgi:hypothetical protein